MTNGPHDVKNIKMYVFQQKNTIIIFREQKILVLRARSSGYAVATVVAMHYAHNGISQFY